MNAADKESADDGTQPGPRRQAKALYPVPLNEDARLAALHGLKILDTPQDERFERIVRLAATHFQTPFARLTFVDRDRTWYKACVGAKAEEGARETAICSHTVMRNEVLYSCDLSLDPQFSASPQVTGGPKLRFYAGAPVTLDDGLRIGSVCIFDIKPRSHFSREDCVFLEDLAQIVVHELELHKQIASRDTSLEEAARQIDLARGAKKRFMDIVSHELKTPLSHVVGFGKILTDQPMGPLGNKNYVEYAQFLWQSAERLEDLINRVLTYSSADSGELRLVETTVAIETIMAKCLELINLSSRTKEIKVTLSIEPGAPAGIFADEVQIAEVVVQLLYNAISFSPPGTSIELEVDSNRDGGVVMRVLDRGPGIEPGRIEHAMDAFTQGDENPSRCHDGIGLGIPVSRALMELHGGTLTLANRPGGGAVAEATLPAYRKRDVTHVNSTVPV